MHDFKSTKQEERKIKLVFFFFFERIRSILLRSFYNSFFSFLRENARKTQFKMTYRPTTILPYLPDPRHYILIDHRPAEVDHMVINNCIIIPIIVVYAQRNDVSIGRKKNRYYSWVTVSIDRKNLGFSRNRDNLILIIWRHLSCDNLFLTKNVQVLFKLASSTKPIAGMLLPVNCWYDIYNLKHKTFTYVL